jgi:hypothetical protein
MRRLTKQPSVVTYGKASFGESLMSLHIRPTSAKVDALLEIKKRFFKADYRFL